MKIQHQEVFKYFFLLMFLGFAVFGKSTIDTVISLIFWGVLYLGAEIMERKITVSVKLTKEDDSEQHEDH